MNIVHVIGSYDPAKGGPQAVVVRLAAAQATLGHEVTIVSYSDDEVSGRAVSATATIPGFDKVRTLLLPMPDLRETLFGGAAAKAMEMLLRSAYGKPICCGHQCFAAAIVCHIAYVVAVCSTCGACNRAHGRRRSR